MIAVVRRKDIVRVVCVLLLAVFLTAAVGASGTAQVFLGQSTRRVPVYSVETEDKKVALTFDAAWGADKTLKIIEILQEFKADGTFFLVGFWIEKYPDETKKIAEAGLEIGNHSNNHLNMSKLNAEDIKREIVTVNEQICKLTGKTPKFFRPPFGDYDNKLIEGVEALDMVPIQWSVDSLDWKGISGEEITARVMKRIKSGSIVLFHNNSDHILDALPVILKQLTEQGYQMVSIDELVMTQDYYVDSQGVQHAGDVNKGRKA